VPLAPSGAPPPLLAGLLVVFVPLCVCENSRPLDLTLKAPQCAVQRLILADPHLGQEATSSGIAARDADIIHEGRPDQQRALGCLRKGLFERKATGYVLTASSLLAWSPSYSALMFPPRE